MRRSLALLALLSALPALAQEEATSDAGTLAATEAVQPDSAHLVLAETLLVLLGTESTMQSAMGTLLDAQIQQNPRLGAYRDIFEDFYREAASWEALKGDLAALYAARFSPDELRAAIVFYETPAGQRFAQQAPVLAQESMQIGQARALELQPKLMERIMERERALRDGTAPTSPAGETEN